MVNKKRGRKGYTIGTAKASRRFRASRVIIVVIVLAALAVVFALVFSLTNTPERVTEARIRGLAENYYEDYFYATITESGGDTAKALAKYGEKGYTKITLRQLLMHDMEVYAKLGPQILKYCDEKATKVQFFPEEPYGVKDYHIEYVFSCEF